MGLGKWVGQPICGTLWHYTQVFKILLMKKYGIKQEIVGWPVCWPTRWFLGDFQHHGGGDPARIPMWNVHGNHCIIIYGYGSIPINTIFSGMNIHLPAMLMFTRGTRFWHTAISSYYLHCMYLHVTEFCTCSVPGHTDEFHWLGNKENLCGSVFGRSLPKTLQITRHWPLGPWAWKVAHGQLIETVCTWFIT